MDLARVYPRGKLTVLDGDPASGKSTIGFDLVARLSRGSALPDGRSLDPAGPQTCLVVSAEDDLEDTIKPRLRAAGADMHLIWTLALRRDAAGNDIPFTVPDDVPDLREVIGKAGAAFVLIDPIMAFLSEDINSHNDASIRKAMSPLSTLAKETRAALLGVRHLTKDTATTKAMYRGGGSIAITAAARSVLMAGRQPGSNKDRVLAQTKSNLAREGHAKSLKYRVESWEKEHSIPKVCWLGTSSISADQLLDQNDSRQNAPAKREAVEFLEDVLTSGPRPVSELNRIAKESGIKEKTLRVAGAENQLVHRYAERDEHGGIKRWMAHLTAEPCPKGCRYGDTSD